MDIKKTIEERQERFIDKWTINCLPLGGQVGKFLGNLFVSDKHLYFEAKFDVSAQGLAESLGLGVSKGLVESWKNNGVLEIAKKDIKEVVTRSSFFKKTVTVVLSDGSEYIFDYGMMGVKKLEEAIKQ